jgi:hypothetical protein
VIGKKIDDWNCYSQDEQAYLTTVYSLFGRQKSVAHPTQLCGIEWVNLPEPFGIAQESPVEG